MPDLAELESTPYTVIQHVEIHYGGIRPGKAGIYYFHHRNDFCKWFLCLFMYILDRQVE